MKTALAPFAIAATTLLAACSSSNIDPATGQPRLKEHKPILKTLSDDQRNALENPRFVKKPDTTNYGARPQPEM